MLPGPQPEGATGTRRRSRHRHRLRLPGQLDQQRVILKGIFDQLAHQVDAPMKWIAMSRFEQKLVDQRITLERWHSIHSLPGLQQHFMKANVLSIQDMLTREPANTAGNQVTDFMNGQLTFVIELPVRHHFQNALFGQQHHGACQADKGLQGQGNHTDASFSHLQDHPGNGAKAQVFEWEGFMKHVAFFGDLQRCPTIDIQVDEGGMHCTCQESFELASHGLPPAACAEKSGVSRIPPSPPGIEGDG